MLQKLFNLKILTSKYMCSPLSIRNAVVLKFEAEIYVSCVFKFLTKNLLSANSPPCLGSPPPQEHLISTSHFHISHPTSNFIRIFNFYSATFTVYLKRYSVSCSEVYNEMITLWSVKWKELLRNHVHDSPYY